MFRSIWYSPWFRIFIVLIPTYWIIIIPILIGFEMFNKTTVNLLSAVYLAIFFLAIINNTPSKGGKNGHFEK